MIMKNETNRECFVRREDIESWFKFCSRFIYFLYWFIYIILFAADFNNLGRRNTITRFLGCVFCSSYITISMQLLHLKPWICPSPPIGIWDKKNSARFCLIAIIQIIIKYRTFLTFNVFSSKLRSVLILFIDCSLLNILCFSWRSRLDKENWRW